MASASNICTTYDFMDKFFRHSFGPHGDISCALYDGDFTKSLQQAQQDKQEWIFKTLQLSSGDRLLDIGCGWGPTLAHARKNGIEAIGLTISKSQARHCRNSGMNVLQQDWKEFDRSAHAPFDGIVVMGALEHFCTPEEYENGTQNALYQRFFDLCKDLIKPKGRLYVQTMSWARNPPAPHEITFDAPHGSDENIMANVSAFYPGSWPSRGPEQLSQCAAPEFVQVFHDDGWRDYVETMNQWANWSWSPSLIPAALRMLPRLMLSQSFRRQLQALRIGANKKLFERRIFSLTRLVLERIEPSSSAP